MTVSNNVFYDVRGHTISLEDGTETNNVFEKNLVIQTKRTYKVQYTDSMPASFWIK